MNKDEIFDLWIARRRQADVPDDFSGRIMDALPLMERFPGAGNRLSRTYLDFAPLRWSTALFLLLAGLFRLSYVTACLLLP